MASSQPRASDGSIASIHPSAWLIVPTFSLAGRARRWPLRRGRSPVEAACIISAASHCCRFAALAPLGMLVASLPSLAFVAGLRAPSATALSGLFAENHLRSVMAQDSALYLEGLLRQEPEKLHEPQPLAVARRAHLASHRRRRNYREHACERARRAARVALRRPGALLDSATAAARQRQSRRLQLRDLSGAAGDLRHRLSRQRPRSRIAGARNRARCAGFIEDSAPRRFAVTSIAAFRRTTARCSRRWWSAIWAASPKKCAMPLPPPGSIMCCRSPAFMSPCWDWWCSG